MSEPALTLEQAAEKAGSFADLNGQLARIEARRQAAIARINSAFDTKIAPLIAAATPLHVELAAWWQSAGEDVRKGKKSIEIGGCTIGTRTGNLTLFLSDAPAEAIKSLQRVKWGKDLLTTTVALNKPLIKAAINGPNRVRLKQMGFSLGRSETFYIDTSAGAKLGAGTRSTSAA